MSRPLVTGEALAGLGLLAVTAAGTLGPVAATMAVLAGTGLLADAFRRVRGRG
jgi:hypothetical protein